MERVTETLEMTTLAKLLAQKQQLIERLDENPGPEEREEIERLLRRVYKQDSQIGRKLIQGCKLEISLDSIDVERRPMGTDCTRAVG